MHFRTYLPIFILSFTRAVWSATVSTRSQCTPFHSKFPASDVSSSENYAPFVVVSPPGSYSVDETGLQLYLKKPVGKITTKDGVNNVVADGATVNSTFTMLYGKVTFEVTAPKVAGVVTAAILIANEHDEIDVELLGGDPDHWQTNIFAPNPKDTQPLWGVFGEIEDLHPDTSIVETHNYTIDWDSERIKWDVDGSVVRTIKKSDTKINGTLHYPSHPTRIQLGIWDASNPVGTSEWAKGPIDWDSAPSRMSATFKSVTVKC
ncbi:hypothetical protein EIP86_001139 [Pleurotus ostreatoroseus]|nr:hypothetical protein EIP86_001139 [Pleurotus ostreatoroseus]